MGATSTQGRFGGPFESSEAAEGMHGGDVGTLCAPGKDHAALRGLTESMEAALGIGKGAELAAAAGDADGERCVCTR
jgi:hypothetical protein